MVTQVMVPHFQCDLCNREYDNEPNALECEAKGIQPYKFIQYQVVRVNRCGDGEYFNAVVHGPGGEDEHLDCHGDVAYYNVKVREHTEGSTKLQYGRYDTDIGANWIKPHIKSGTSCPLCGTASTQVVDDYYNGEIIPEKSVILHSVEVTECPSCKLNFFTQEQLETVKKRIMEANIIPDEVANMGI